jgi:hypothetical protein
MSGGPTPTAPPTTVKQKSGRTTPGVGWVKTAPSDDPDGPGGIVIDVPTATGFRKDPIYVISLGGDGHHWKTTGDSSVYPPKNGDPKTGFRVFLRSATGGAEIDGIPLDRLASEKKWYINWVAIESR